ncbi:MAG: hypothetical protein WBW53_15130 [Terriglobales bacterium]
MGLYVDANAQAPAADVSEGSVKRWLTGVRFDGTSVGWREATDKIRALIVDDSPVMRKIVERSLR